MGDNSIYQRASPAESDEINLTSEMPTKLFRSIFTFPWHNIRPMIEHHSSPGSPPVPLMASPFPSVQHRAHLERDTKDVLTKSIQPVEIKHTRGSSLFSLPLSRINQYSVGSVYCDSIGFPIQLLFATHKPCHIFLFHIFDFPQFLCHYTVIYSFCKITPCVHCTEKSAACQVRPQLFFTELFENFPQQQSIF